LGFGGHVGFLCLSDIFANVSLHTHIFGFVRLFLRSLSDILGRVLSRVYLSSHLILEFNHFRSFLQSLFANLSLVGCHSLSLSSGGA